MKPQFMLKSLADIPANTVSIAPSMPGRSMNVTKRVIGPAARITRGEMRAARQRSLQFTLDIQARANEPFVLVTPWQRGGLSE
jgi:hypothetical protein